MSNFQATKLRYVANSSRPRNLGQALTYFTHKKYKFSSMCNH